MTQASPTNDICRLQGGQQPGGATLEILDQLKFSRLQAGAVQTHCVSDLAVSEYVIIIR